MIPGYVRIPGSCSDTSKRLAGSSRSETAGSRFEREFSRPRPGYAGSRAGGGVENMVPNTPDALRDPGLIA